MRPIRLTMQAFGPFAGREVVDFPEAMASGLFGIYGQTGAGKSTIFSAVTFALFGEATKADQDTASLRSDHADPGVATEVEFVFEVGERRYVVRRSPDQMRPKLRGAGETRMAHEALLFDATGVSLEEIGRGNCGKIIAEKKLGQVRDAVIEVLGYGPDQFRQIVLLPQGKFEMFLASKTDARLEILRDLFDVTLYRRLATSFKERAAEAEQTVKRERGVCVRRLATEGFESSEALAEGIAVAEGEQECALRAERTAYRTVAEVRAKLDAAGKVDGLFQTAEAAASELAGLCGREHEVRTLEERVKNARLAQGLADVERHAAEAREIADECAGKMKTASDLAAGAIEAAEIAAAALEGQRAKAHEIDGLRRTSDTLGRHQTALTGSAELRRVLNGKTVLLGKAKTALDTASKQRATLAAAKATQEQVARQARDNEASRATLNLEFARLGIALKDAEQFEKAQENLEKTGAKVVRLEATLKTKAEAVVESKSRFDRAEASLAAAQAVHLAAKLAPGELCPVCGSLDHPAPATGKIENQGLDQAFREARQALEIATDERDKAAAETAGAKGAREALEKDVAMRTRPTQSSAVLREREEAVKARIAKLGPEVDVAAAERLAEQTGSAVVTAEGAKEAARGEFGRLREDEAMARGHYENALSSIPQEYRDQSVLKKALDDTNAEILTRQAALKSAEDRERHAREDAIGAEKGAQAARAAYEDALGRSGQAQATFARRLEETGMTEESYGSIKLHVPTIDADAKRVDEYRTSVEVARKREDDARAAIAELERLDLEPFAKALQASETAARAATDQRAAADTKLAHLRGVRDAIAESMRNMEELEKGTAPLRELARLFNAENAMKLDLETYAIGAMFDYVLKAANLRLGPMTSGRYSLERETERAGGRSRRGLGISVFDLHTGKGRSPSTLSGGETFIAALALALGLSDVVESVNGKVHLDTIFIDEGFGSLDTENDLGTLDQVLQVLTNLVSQKRAVGLISHVHQVQDLIPNGFYVRKELRGSRIEIRAAAA